MKIKCCLINDFTLHGAFRVATVKARFDCGNKILHDIARIVLIPKYRVGDYIFQVRFLQFKMAKSTWRYLYN